MSNRNVKLKNLDGEYLYPYTENFPKDTTPVSGSTKTITSGAVYTALQGKLNSTATAARATADASGNDIASTYLKKTDTAAKATADADGNNIASTYLKKNEEGRGGLNLLVSQLQKAYAWTWSQTLTSGTAYIVYNNNGGKLDGISCSSYCPYADYNGYVGINKNIYYFNASASPVTLTQITTSNDITFVGYGTCIKGGTLYSYFSSKVIDSGTGWTKLSGFFGIKNGTLGTFNNQTNTNSAIKWGIIDTEGVWTDISVPYVDSGACGGIRDGYPFYVARGTSSGEFCASSLVQLDTENGWEHVYGGGTSGYLYFTKGTKYKCFRNSGTSPYYSGDVGEQIEKLYSNYVLTSSGKVYRINTNSPVLLTSDAIDISVYGYLKSDGLYNYSGTKIVDGTYQAYEGQILFAGAGSTQYKTIYTVANPSTNYKTYERLDLTYQDTVTATTSTTVTSGGKIYTRDITKDSVFTQTPDDLKKQTPTKWELIDMINNL